MEEGRTTSRELVEQYLHAHRALRRPLQRGARRQSEGAEGSRRARPGARRRARCADRCTAFRSRSRTTSTPPTCRPPAARWRSTASMPPYEATLTKNLRDAGAIIIAKTGMTELANWVAGAPTPMPGNYNARRRLRLQPVRSAPRSARRDRRRPAGAADRRIELGHRHRRELLGRQRRHRNVGLDPQPVEPEHAGRHQADGRPHQPLRRDSDHRRSGHRRADGEDGHRRRDPARRARRRRRPIRTMRRPRPARRRRTATTRRSSKRDGAEGRAHRHPARVLLRPRRRCRATKEPRGGLNAAQAKAMAEAIAVLKQQGAVDRRSRRHPERRRSRIRRTTSCSGTPAPAPTTAKGKDDDCSVVFKYGMKRDFNAWLASLGPAAPVKTLTELRDVEHRAREGAARSSTGRRSSTSPTRWTSSATARATRPTARRTCVLSRRRTASTTC